MVTLAGYIYVLEKMGSSFMKMTEGRGELKAEPPLSTNPFSQCFCGVSD
jgi:hypothetical protein